MKEYIALARARPAEITYGTSGPGTSHNMLGEALKLAAKVNITHAPYQGEAPAVIAAVGGHITGVLVNLFSTAPFIKAASCGDSPSRPLNVTCSFPTFPRPARSAIPTSKR